MSSIVLTGGGTAGHCTPNIALLPYLKKEFENIYYIGSKTGIEKNIVKNAGLPYYEITTAKLNRSITLKNLTIPIKVIKGINEAKEILKTIKPDVIFSKGGFVSLPVIIAGSKLGILVISHESDLTMGLSNKLSKRYCKKILTAFPETAMNNKNAEYVGAPLRDKLYNVNKQKAKEFFGFKNSKPVILITGGSLGAVKINGVVKESLDKLLEKFNVIHICGKGNMDNSRNSNSYYQAEYLENMEYAFAVSDIAVSRAGANSLFELFSLKIPSIIIPLPKGNSRGDQVLNAEYFKAKGFCKVINQEDLTPHTLIFAINSVYENKEKYIENLTRHKIENATPKIAEIICGLKK